MKDIRWTQWSNDEMIRCGRSDYFALMNKMKENGIVAKACLANENKNHAIYGQEIHDNFDEIMEIRFYCELYMDDKELDSFIKRNKNNIIYAIHK